MQTIYKLKTGHITKTVFGPIEHITIAPDESAIEGFYNSDEWWISQAGPVRKDQRPDNTYVAYNYETYKWEDTRSLQEQTVALASEQITQRNSLLAASDWVVLPYSPVKNLEEWLVYRQALRDITLQPGFPESVVWPSKPVV